MVTNSSHDHASHSHGGHRDDGASTKADGTLKDPVCGMTVTAQSDHHLEHAGQPYYFCSAGCQIRFSEDPKKYIFRESGANAMTTAPSAAGAIFTCPMHPEIRQDHPGNCPKCGMALEPEMPTLDDDENPELVDFTRRFWWTLPFSVVVAVLAMAGHRFALFHGDTQNWVELVLTLPVVLWAGWPFYVRGVQSVINRSPNMWTLISLGTSMAFLYSLAATVTPQPLRVPMWALPWEREPMWP